MSDELLSRRRALVGAAVFAATPLIFTPTADAVPGDYSQDEVLGSAQRFFGAGARGLAAVVARVFRDNGRPVGFITGNEGSGAIGVGLRFGNGGMTFLRRRIPDPIYWRGPSVGFDTGGNAARVFTLIYNMRSPDQIYRRYPGVDGSAYFVGGVGVNYQRADGITLAPIRAGVGFRLGANIGYLHYSRRRYGLPL